MDYAKYPDQSTADGINSHSDLWALPLHKSRAHLSIVSYLPAICKMV